MYTPTPTVAAGELEHDPRESMRRLPSPLQYPLTVLTGKPLSGQRPLPWWSPTYHFVAALASAAAGLALSTAGWAEGGWWLLLLLPGWAMTLHGLRNLRMMIFHQCAHRNMYRRRRLDTAIGGALAALLLVQNFERYSREHVSDHHAAQHMTLRDPTTQAVLLTLGLLPGMTRGEMYRKVTRKVTSPLFHAAFAWGRMRSFWYGAFLGERITAIILHGGAVAVCAVTDTLPALLVIWCVPLLPLFQVVNVTRLCVKHTFPEPGLPIAQRRGKAYFGSLTHAVFLGEPAPAAGLPPIRAAVAWTMWTARMLLVHAPMRYLVVTGDTPVHDWHHRHPAARDWAHHLFARQADLDAGSPDWPPYTASWGLVPAMSRIFDSICAADPEEYSPARIRDVSKRELFAAFDD